MADDTDKNEKPPQGKPANSAPDAVMDPSEKTDGKPGQGPQGDKTPDDETDPGGG
ncbi:hypothetical protein [Methylobacterium sp. E-045]|uniref:hypothetical protein n=1 Tax=Methylobacterium sp. E-045 TaxID=2836575 RepID=UPI001FBB2F76|nr:hypothetical protein [Methylobacterium sp. E-045]MCJ2127797.1 hypothetical protein [Methylobacterium sp. E-045]